MYLKLQQFCFIKKQKRIQLNKRLLLKPLSPSTFTDFRSPKTEAQNQKKFKRQNNR